MNHLVSIIIPTYNRAHVIQRSINSIMRQTYQNFEIIIVDDGSTDNTKSIIDNLKERHKKIKYICLPCRKGANSARNKGVIAARGKYIAFQDSDDQWLPNKLFLQMDAIEKTGFQATFTSYCRIQGQNQIRIPKRSRQIKPSVHSFHEELLEGNFIALPTLLIDKKMFFEAGGFDEKLERFQDWELLLRVSKLTDLIYIDQPLVNAYLNNDNITLKKNLYSKALKYIIQKHQKDFEAHPIALAAQYLHLATDSVQMKKTKESMGYIYLALLQGIKPILTLGFKYGLPSLRLKKICNK